MNEGNLRPVTYFVLVALSIVCSCSSNQPIAKTPAEPSPSTQQASPPSPPAQSTDANESSPATTVAPPSTKTSGEIAWAKGFEGALIAGLDGALYEPYALTTIERIQRDLTRRGL